MWGGRGAALSGGGPACQGTESVDLSGSSLALIRRRVVCGAHTGKEQTTKIWTESEMGWMCNGQGGVGVALGQGARNPWDA